MEQIKNNIMIVEDDSLNQKIYNALFSEEYHIKICSNDAEMYAALSEDKFNLFIVDLALQSEKDGIQLIKELRQMEEYKNTPIMVVTSFAFQKDRTNAMEAGADEVFFKPIDNKVLLAEVKKYF